MLYVGIEGLSIILQFAPLKRWLAGTHQETVRASHIGYYLDEITFRFNRRASLSRGKLVLSLGPAGRSLR